MVRGFREEVDTASVIKGVLDCYPEDAILRELLQNSDDAGSTIQTFYLDTRTHPSDSLIDPHMKTTQGPALIAVNNSVFRESDWEALSKIHGSNKTLDQNKTGKYGLGFRACYHTTDNPHIFSTNQLVIFDPHNEFQEVLKGGVMIEIEKDGGRYRDQLAAFSPAVANAMQPFDGTAIRLPLRTPDLANRSRIKKQPTSVQDIRHFFHEFAKNELRLALLFLKNIERIELREIALDGSESVIGVAEIDDVDDVMRKRRAFERSTAAHGDTFKLSITIHLDNEGTVLNQQWRIMHSVFGVDDTAAIMTERLGYPAEQALIDEKLYSHVALAFPLESNAPFEGRLFTLLPLPIKSGFPLYMHAILALTPDRQNLRNMEVMGFSEKSREVLLVTWNQVVFERFVPSAWARLISTITEDDQIPDFWSAWPRLLSNDSKTYWSGLLRSILDVIVGQDLAVFPHTSSDNVLSYLRLGTPLVAPPGTDSQILNAISSAGIQCITLPDDVYNSLRAQEFACLAQKSLQERLLNDISKLASTNNNDKAIILEYLVNSSPTNLRYLHDLPLIPCISGDHVALTSPSHASHHFLLLSDDELNLYHDNNAVACRDLPPKVIPILTSPNAETLLNVTVLKANHVVKFLQSRLGHLDSSEANHAVSEDTTQWTIDFWKWICLRPTQFSSTVLDWVQELHILPTSGGGVRRLRSRVMLGAHLDAGVLNVLSQTRVPLLRDGVRIPVSGYTVPHSDLPFVLDMIDATKFDDMVEKEKLLFCQYLSQVGRNISLGDMQTAKLSNLPIFRVVIPDTSGSPVFKLDRARGRLIFINTPAGSPLPVPPQDEIWTYLHAAKNDTTLLRLLDVNVATKTLDELGLLKLALPYLTEQPTQLKDSLVARFISRVSDLPPTMQQKLRTTPFVKIRGSTMRAAPEGIIDPESHIAPLFEGSSNRFPDADHCRTVHDTFLQVLRSVGFFQSQLTPEIVEERLSYVSTHGDIGISRLLLSLLDRYWSAGFGSVLARGVNWLPTTAATLTSASGSRDSIQSVYLFDQVLQVVDYNVNNAQLRRQLGWDVPISKQVLLTQLRLTLTNRLRPMNRRLTDLIKQLAISDLSSEDVETLREIVQGLSWVPAGSVELVKTEHVLLSVDTHPYGPFRRVSYDLNGEMIVGLLKQMGCTDRPTSEVFIFELEAMSISTVRLDIALQMLRQLADLMPISTELRSRILAPDHNCQMRHLEALLYNDLDIPLSTSESVKFPSHPEISKSLAKQLLIPFMSSIQLDAFDDEDEEDDDEDMHEDLVGRINGLLNDYDPKYAINEFLANASDAGATDFSLFVDERSFSATKILSPDIKSLQTSPSLILFNNQTLSVEDFSGLRSIGKGGKVAKADTIGRFGLGALSAFHFTEMPMVISGKYLMFLDPSGQFLPLRKGQRRLSFKGSLAMFSRRYPDHLRTVEGLFGFSMVEPHYKGTIFRFSLRHQPSAISQHCMTVTDCLEHIEGSYRQLSHDSLFFTNLTNVTFWTRLSSSQRDFSWSVSIQKDNRISISDYYSQHLVLTFEGRNAPAQQHWILVGKLTSISSVPREHYDTLGRLKLTANRAGVPVELVFPLGSAKATENEAYLFSGLRLPQKISLKAHVNSIFALAPDRRSIRFDAPDISGNRGLEASFNAWILGDIVPRVYMFGLHVITSTPSRGFKDNSRWWPQKVADDISRQIVEGFYVHLNAFDLPICWTASHEMITPSQAVFRFQEPYSVSKILELLRAPTFVPTRPDILVLLRDVNIVTKQIFSNLITQHREEMRALWLQLDRVTLTVDDIATALGYLLSKIDGEEVLASVSDLPLLVLADKSLVDIPSHSCSPVFWNGGNADKDLYRIFPATKFVYARCAKPLLPSLIARPEVNIKLFDASAARVLILEKLPCSHRLVLSQSQMSWMNQFHRYFSSIPGPLTASHLEGLPIIQTFNAGEYVSIQHVLTNNVLPGPTDPQISTIATKLKILVIKPAPDLLTRLLGNNGIFSFETFLVCLSAPTTLPLSSLLLEDHEIMAEWIIRQAKRLTGATRTVAMVQALLRLPIFPAILDRRQTFCPVAEVNVLPHGVSRNDIIRYLVPGKILSSASQVTEVQRFMNALGQSQRQTVDRNVHQYLQLPSALQPNQLDQYKRLVRALLAHSSQNIERLKIPNGNLDLVAVSSLYDSRVELYDAAFRDQAQRCHPHPEFSQLQADLRSAGLIHEVTFDHFLRAVREFQGNVTEDGDETELEGRATRITAYYFTTMPQKIMSNALRWAQINPVRFIPRNPHRHRSILFDVDEYCVPIPNIVSPDMLVRQDHESVAWTQRALFLQQPPTNMTQLHPSIGVPRVQEVVQHLVALATKVCLEHSGSQLLLCDLIATYTWLSSNLAASRHLLLAQENVKLFLNVDDPTEVWDGNWCSAKDLVVNLHYDSKDLIGVRNWLLDRWKPLVIAAGGSELSNPKYQKGPTSAPKDDSLKSMLNELRKKDQLTDITLEPTKSDPTADQRQLRAHKVILAASIPHLRTALVDEWKESLAGVYSFEGTHFAAKSIIEYVYTGDIEVHEATDDDQKMELLRDLLELLSTADSWDMDDLKLVIGETIADTLKVVAPHTVDMILAQATKYSAGSLVTFCQEFKRRNRALLKNLEDR